MPALKIGVSAPGLATVNPESLTAGRLRPHRGFETTCAAKAENQKKMNQVAVNLVNISSIMPIGSNTWYYLHLRSFGSWLYLWICGDVSSKFPREPLFDYKYRRFKY